MKRIQRRALAVLVPVMVILALTALYIARWAVHGGEWAGFTSNGDAFIAGRIRAGTILDRYGQILYTVRDGEGVYSDDRAVRLASLHIIGDRDGFIGSGALFNYAGTILGYDPVNGLFSYDGSGGVLNMSVDASAQRAAWEALDGRNGAVVVIDYVTGEVICSVSAPAFDPDDPPEIDSGDTSGIYLDRPLSAVYTPGSVFKLVTLAAAIENIDGVFDRDFHCDGSMDVGGGRVTCTQAHGDMKLEDALAVSCNCVFGRLALELGGETLKNYAAQYGLTERQSVDMLRTAAGRFDAAPDGSLDLAWSGAGQYNDLVNPMAMARFVAAIAESGYAPKLTMVKDTLRLGAEREHILNAATAEKIARIMDYAVQRTYGAENFPGLELYAKSGTAEVGAGRPNAWFTGFIRDPDHPYAFAVCLEDAGYGSAQAAPVANAVLQAAINH